LISPAELSFLKSAHNLSDIKFLDAPLCQIGRTQAEASQNIVAQLPIKYVITSPLARTLETTQIVFDKHVYKNNIEVIVHPLIRECLTSSDDIPKWTLITQREKYEREGGLNYNFSMLESMHKGLYFLESVEPELKKLVTKELGIFGEDKYPEILIKLMEDKARLVDNKHEYVESFTNTRKRAKSFLVWLKKFMKEKQVKPSEIAVVTHMYFLQCLAAKKFNIDGTPIYPAVANAMPFQIDIDELLKYY
jgi:broad specificity phosphatase PhoE